MIALSIVDCSVAVTRLWHLYRLANLHLHLLHHRLFIRSIHPAAAPGWGRPALHDNAGHHIQRNTMVSIAAVYPQVATHRWQSRFGLFVAQTHTISITSIPERAQHVTGQLQATKLDTSEQLSGNAATAQRYAARLAAAGGGPSCCRRRHCCHTRCVCVLCIFIINAICIFTAVLAEAPPTAVRTNVPAVSLRPAEVEDGWVTVFGFQPQQLELVLQEFQKCGDIEQFGTFGQGQSINWVHIQYQVCCWCFPLPTHMSSPAHVHRHRTSMRRSARCSAVACTSPPR